MKNLAFLVVLLLLAFPAASHGQSIKVLFDNTHLETAGNADWIIDTDQPVPAPAQSGITPSTAESYWLGAISAWGVDLVKLGYTVHTLTTTYGITYGNAGNAYDLSNYKLFIVCEPQTRFSAAEKSAILAFVQNGGGLMMVADHYGSDRNSDGWDSPMIWNDLGSDTYFGIHFQVLNESNNNISAVCTNVATSASDSVIHGPSGVATSISYHNGTTMNMLTANNPNAAGHIWMNSITRGTTQVVAATSRYGQGKIAAVGDSSPADDGTGQSGNTLFTGWNEVGATDNIVFLNMCSWLTTAAPTVPAQVTLVSPANGATGIVPPATLRWNKPSGAAGYQLDVSTSNTFSSSFLTDSTLTDTLRSVGGFALNTVYYWRVRAKNALGWGAYSAARSFTSWNVPAAPTLMSPSDGAANTPSPSLMRWNAVATATGYEIDVALSNTFSPMFLSDSTLVDTSRSVGGFALNTLYYWRVRAKNGAGWGSYSATLSFTSWNVPPAVTLVSPVDGGTNVPSPSLFRWNAAALATGYQIDLSTSNTFLSFVLSDSTLTDTARSVGGFAANSTYYWRVRAKDGAGWGGFSVVRSFTASDVPASVTLVSPSDGMTNLPSPSQFRWNTAALATGYQIDISTVNTFLSLFLSDSTLTDTVRTTGGFAAGTTYYWRVRAKDGVGWGAFSATRSFTTFSVPSAVTLVSPADGATGIVPPAALLWNTAPSATTYELDVSTSNIFATFSYMDSTLIDTGRAVGGLAAGTPYYWRVRAKNGVGWGPWSAVRGFTTVDAPPAVALLSPAQGAVGITVPTAFLWTSAVTATGYEIDLSLLPDFSITAHKDSSLTDTTALVGGLLPDTVYYWTVRARNAGGWGSYSSMGFFRTWKTPSQVLLDSPADSAAGVSMPVGFRWHPATNGVLYRLAVTTAGPSPVTVFVDSSITDTSWSVSTLSQGTTYRWYAASRNAAGWGYPSVLRTFTTWHVPAQVGLLSPPDGATGLAHPVPLAWHSPDPATAFELQVSTSGSFSTTVVDDSTLADTLALVSPADSLPVYYWRVRAKGAAGWGAFSSARSFSLFHVDELTTEFNGRWNLVSVPLTVADPRVTTLFPAASSPAYAFDGGYVQKDSLLPGVGYWLKFASAAADTIAGIERLADTIAVHAGWNLIGSLSVPVNAASVTSIPAGIVASQFYAFEASYTFTDTLQPFRGYWVKCTADGVLILR